MDVLVSELLLRKVVPVANPLGGADWITTVPAKEIAGPGFWLLKSIQATLAQGATQTPQPVLIIDDGGAGGAIGSAGNHIVCESVGATTAQTAGTTATYCWTENVVQSGIQGSGADTHSQSPLPMGDECVLLPGWRIGTHTLGIGANSQWSSILLYVAQIG
jgi:hypothetical protein